MWLWPGAPRGDTRPQVRGGQVTRSQRAKCRGSAPGLKRPARSRGKSGETRRFGEGLGPFESLNKRVPPQGVEHRLVVFKGRLAPS
jgi:hypothetical protein